MLDEQFWDEESKKMFDVMFPIIEKSAITAAINASESLGETVGIGVSFELVNEAAVNYARGHTLELVKGINKKTKSVIQKKLGDHMAAGDPLSAFVRDFINAEDIGGMVGKVRAEMIAITEVTKAFQEGNIISWAASGEVDGFKFRTAADDIVCPICAPLEGLEFNLAEIESSPPVHPRCRCWSQPKLKEAA